MLYEKFIRPQLFGMDPEEAHESVITLLALAQDVPAVPPLLSTFFGKSPAGFTTEVFGLKFPNPIGLAAGFDKDCRLSRIMPALGFGFVELGSVTLRPQPGNPKPRLFRLTEHQALINRLGFNGAGARAAAYRLKTAKRSSVPIGINLGLNADCPKEKAAQEYTHTFGLLEPYADYFAINVSSPNTAGLRDLQERLSLEKILLAVQAENKNKKPILVKISPDISDAQIPDTVKLIQYLASGIIVANTTTSREGLPGDLGEIRGGLSGKPLRARSTALIRKVYGLTQGKLPIIGVGGIFTGGDAFEKIRAGASLVQIYTGLVYRGPATAHKINLELLECLKRSGFKSLADARGTAKEEEVTA